MVWGYVIAYTSQSRANLLTFGAVSLTAFTLAGYAFSEAMAPRVTPQERRQRLAGMDPEQQRFAAGTQQRLSAMLKDFAEGKGEAHWNAAMRGTLVPHPAEVNRTQGVDAERAAQALVRR